MRIRFSLPSLAAILAAALSLGTCAPAPPTPVSPTAPSLSPEESLRLLGEREASIRTARARLKLSFEGSSFFRRSGEVEAFLLVSKPDRVRLRAIGFLGLTLFDMILDGREIEVYVPSRRVLYKGEPGAGSQSALFRCFLSLTGGPTSGEEASASAGENGEVQVDARQGFADPEDGKEHIVERRLALDGPTAVPLRAEILLDGEPWATVAYAGHAEEAGIPIPMSIDVHATGKDMRMSAQILEIALNEPIADGAWRFADLGGVEVKPLEANGPGAVPLPGLGNGEAAP